MGNDKRYQATPKRLSLCLSIALGIAVTFFVLGCGGRDKKPTHPSTSKTAEEYTQEGWTAFESGNASAAQSSFSAAVETDPNYGPAYVGKGWCDLVLATSSTAVSSALVSFDSAYSRGEIGPDVRSGRAAAQLALGGSFLPSAAAEAQAAIQAAPSFTFQHRASFDVTDLRLIVAFAQAGQLAFTTAQATADQIQPSGIQQGNPATWTVGGTTYPIYEAAVLAHLQKLSQDHAG